MQHQFASCKLGAERGKRKITAPPWKSARMRWGSLFITAHSRGASGNSSLSNANRRHTRTARSFEIRATRRASEASLGGLDRCMRLGPVEPKKWQAPGGHAGRAHARFCGRIDHTSSRIDHRTTARRVVRAAHRAIRYGTTQQPAIDGAGQAAGGVRRQQSAIDGAPADQRAAQYDSRTGGT